MNMEHLKRKFLTCLAMLPWLASCKTSASAGTAKLTPAQRRLQGFGLTLVVDAVPGAEMLGNEFFAAGSETPFYASSVTRQGNRSIMAFPSGTVPESVRVVWRDSSKIIGRADNPKINTYAGNILGDYSIPVASRIPDEVVQEIRNNGGGLRLKFRLKPDGVLFGWDIERFSGGLPRHTMPGGDFLQTSY